MTFFDRILNFFRRTGPTTQGPRPASQSHVSAGEMHRQMRESHAAVRSALVRKLLEMGAVPHDASIVIDIQLREDGRFIGASFERCQPPESELAVGEALRRVSFPPVPQFPGDPRLERSHFIVTIEPSDLGVGVSQSS